MTSNITFNTEIPENEFNEFLEVLKEIDPTEYETESKDGFVDLYYYWTGAGYRRFSIKFQANKGKQKNK